MTRAELVCRWLVGSLVGTLLFATTSPLFVRSYLPRKLDPVRGVLVPPEASLYRWRSEGYATTRIGPHGMPGRRSINAVNAMHPSASHQTPTASPPGTVNRDALRIAIWGDSQAEGVCVADHFKVHQQIEATAGPCPKRGLTLSGHAENPFKGYPPKGQTPFRTEPPQQRSRVVALPLARSGDDANSWLAQIPRVEKPLAIDAHLILIAELSDLAAAEHFEPQAEPELATLRRQNAASTYLPAFIIQAIRRITRNPDDTKRKLRFAVGPVAEPPINPMSPTDGTDWGVVLRRLRSVTRKPVLLVYAPNVPNLVTHGGSQPRTFINTENVDRQSFQQLRLHPNASELLIIDLEADFLSSASRNQWPHGFHHGRIGSGHLNAIGYSLIATAVSAEIEANPQRFP